MCDWLAGRDRSPGTAAVAAAATAAAGCLLAAAAARLACSGVLLLGCCLILSFVLGYFVSHDRHFVHRTKVCHFIKRTF